MRKQVLKRRALAHAHHAEAASAALLAALSGLSGHVVAGYLPIRSEADPRVAMQALAARNRVCVPVVVGPGQPLRFRAWQPGCALEEGAFRVMVPKTGAWLTPDVLIVPMVVYDPRLFRLGYGGGFYDRTLQALRGSGAVRAIGFAYGAQQVDAVPVESTDEPLDALVTEAGEITPAR